MPKETLFTELEMQSILEYGEKQKNSEKIAQNPIGSTKFNISKPIDGSSVTAKDKKTVLRPRRLASYQEDIVADQKDPEGLFFSKAMVLGTLIFFGFVVLAVLFLAVECLDAIKFGKVENPNSLSGLSWLSGSLGIIVTVTGSVALSAVISYMNKTKLPSVINNEAKAHKYALENRLDYNFQMMEKQHELKMTDQEVARIESSGEAKQISDSMFTDMNSVIKTAKANASADLKKETI